MHADTNTPTHPYTHNVANFEKAQGPPPKKEKTKKYRVQESVPQFREQEATQKMERIEKK